MSRLLSGAKHSVVSLIRDESHGPDILETGAKPLNLSLEEASISELSKVFQGTDVVYFTAGAGGKCGSPPPPKVSSLPLSLPPFLPSF